MDATVRVSRTIKRAYQVLARLKHLAVRAARYIKHLFWRMVRGPAEGWSTFLLLLILLTVVAWSLRTAHSVPTPGLYSIALWSVLLGLILAKIPLRGWLLVTSGVLVGLYLSFYYLTSLAEAATALDRHTEIATRLSAWWQSIAGSDPADDSLPLSLFLVCASWAAGFTSSWSLFRKHNIWGTLLPGGIVVVASLTTMLPERQGLQLYLYLFAAFLLAARLFTLQRQRDWDRRSIQYLPHESGLRAPDGLWFAVTVVLVASLLPIRPTTVDPMATALYTISRPVQTMGFELYRTLGGVPPKRPQQAHSFEPIQTLGGRTALRKEPAIIVRTPLPTYLAARSYDVYTYRGWEGSDVRTVSPEWTPEYGAEITLVKMHEVDIEVTTMFPLKGGDPIFLSGYPVDISVDHQFDVLSPALYSLQIPGDQLESPVAAEYLPRDMKQTLMRLSEASHASDHALTESEIRSILPDDIRVVSWEYTDAQVTGIIAERYVPVPHDIVSVRAAHSLAAGGSYRATVLVSTANERHLLTAGTDYPGWILDRYLQLPDDVPSRVTGLAEELAGDAETPYEKAIAVRDYLRTLDYTVDIETPPRGVDAVDHFLFELQEGYCSYFASAMTIMLRACGVPARFVTGYATEQMVDEDADEGTGGHQSNQRQAEQRTFVARNSHAWCEVFFPDYGWIPFEPTPGYTIITGDDLAELPSEDGGGEREIAPERGEESGIAAWLPTDPPDDDMARPHPSPGETQPDRRDMRQLLLPLGVATGLTALGLAFWLARRRLFGEMTEPRLAYSRTGYLAALSGLGPQDNLTPYEYGSRLTTAVPEVSASLERIVDTYVRTCYRQHGITEEDRRKVAEAWPPVRNHLVRRALRGLLPGRLR